MSKKGIKRWVVLLLSLGFMIIAGGCGGGGNVNGGGVVSDDVISNDVISNDVISGDVIGGGFDPARYISEIVNLTNDARINKLEIDANLMAAAAQRAKEIATVFSHDRPDGRPLGTVFEEFNIVISEHRGFAENILYNMSENPAYAMEMWMNSPVHRASIENPVYTHIGVGLYLSEGYFHVVLLFWGR
jgi:hypothetical protein